MENEKVLKNIDKLLVSFTTPLKNPKTKVDENKKWRSHMNLSKVAKSYIHNQR